ncbi:aryl-alcohol oxidase-like protein [Cyathus striatus]|nr:aryl-alcohol oxidase-like protein [Cyathus striatus]
MVLYTNVGLHISGGTAGSVIANRLTENPNFRVLVLEAGPSNQGVLDIESPGLDFNLENSPFDWNFTTIPQAGLLNRPLAYPRGHVLGGSSSINAMFYTRGSSDDYDRWAAVTGDDGWSWSKILPFILKNEHFTTPADGHSTVGQFNPVFHNFNGINFVSLPGFAEPFDDKMIQTSKDLKEFPFNLDTNSGTPLGLGWLQSTIGNGTRSSAATSYLGPQFINRPNLDVVLNTLIARVLPSSNGNNPDLRTIQFKSGTDKTLRSVTAQKELILSLGSIGTPHILLNSGIGDEEELRKVGVSPILNLPSVGKNLTDQPDLSLTWLANLTATPENFTAVFNLWLETRTGPLANGAVNQVAWTRVPETSSIFKDFVDPSAGPHTPHFEFVLEGSPHPLSSNQSTIGLGLAVVTPASRGSVSLNSNDPFDAPLIDPAFLTDEVDIFIMKEGIASAQRFFEGPAWKDIIIQPQFADALESDEALEHFIRFGANITAHPVGTAAMSPKGAQFGVVDPDLLLKGATGLRVVDASIMPFITCGHPQAPTYAIAERAADLIKKKWA